jgi:dihydrofolate reductase
MKKLVLKTVISLDGFMSAPNEAMDWFDPNSDEEWDETLTLAHSSDTVLLGAGMYPGYSQYWRQALAEPNEHSKNEVSYARWADQTRHIVFSRRLKQADWANTEIRRNVLEDVPALKGEPGRNLLVFGGSIFAGTLIELGLVDEYHLMVVPILLGGGKRLFKDESKRRNLKRISAKPFRSGAIMLSYVA